MKYGFRARSALVPTMAILVAAAATLAASCDNSYGLFKSIQLETEQVGTDIFTSISVNRVVGDGSYYFAATSKLYRRTQSGTTWELVPEIGLADYFVSGLAVDGTTKTLYAASADPLSLELIGVYSSTDSATWTALADPALASGEIPQNLFVANGVPFLLTRESDASDSDYTLREYGEASPGAWSDVLTGLGSPVVSVVWDGASYWAAAGTKIYKGATAAALTADATSGTPSGGSKTFKALLADETEGTAYVACDDGTAYKMALGAWTSKTIVSGVELGAMALVPVSATSNRLLVAKNDESTYGYVEYDWDASTKYAGSDGSVVPTESSYSTTVYGKPVNSFYFDGSTLFVCLASGYEDDYGLFSNTWDGSEWSGWTAE